MLYTTLCNPAVRALRQGLPAYPSVDDGMSRFLDGVAPKFRGPWVARLRKVRWSRDLREFEAWLESLLGEAPLPRRAKCVWIEVPEVIWNEPTTQFCAFDVFDPVDRAMGLDDSRLRYPPDRALEKVGIFAFGALRDAVGRLELTEDISSSIPGRRFRPSTRRWSHSTCCRRCSSRPS